MVRQAMAEHGFDPRRGWMIGDKEADVGLGHAVGAQSILVRTGYGREHEPNTHADFITDDLAAAIDLILSN
jgi:D-glycero-D-manno-heptose 1,7-bisphosphate phosphatase